MLLRTFTKSIVQKNIIRYFRSSLKLIFLKLLKRLFLKKNIKYNDKNIRETKAPNTGEINACKKKKEIKIIIAFNNVFCFIFSYPYFNININFRLFQFGF